MGEQLFELRRRTFDTPQFRGIEFIEVEAKSIINHVPGNYLPFNWTINPYRGCSHACLYCMRGDTPILMADGRTKPLADLEIHDAIYGTVREGNYRRYVETRVLAHWSTVKPAYRITLEDGAELIASGDHRFLSDRGWKHVTGSEQGRDRRAHLTINNKLMGVGKLAPPPEHDADYKRGYLCGLIRGDGLLRSYSYDRPGRVNGDVHRFRLALVDVEALIRAREFLKDHDVVTRAGAFGKAVGFGKSMNAISTSTLAGVTRTREIIRWPRAPSDAWRKGFLAGIYDAEGGFNAGILRFSNTDPVIIDQISSSLHRFNFTFVREKQKGANRPVQVVRITRGLKEQLRFFLTVDPSITRKRTFDGTALKSKAKLRVLSIEPLGIDIPMYDITTGTGDFIANGVVSHNCFARVTHTYMDMNAGRDFESKIVVKTNAPDLLRKELRAKRWKGEHIAMGTATDPYQRAEGKYKLMPRIIGALSEIGNPFSILTKGTLILRDLDLLAEAAEHGDVSTALSIGTLDQDAWRRSEPGTPHPRKRMDAVRKLNDAGIPCGVMVAPVLPGISDDPAQLKEVVSAAVDAGATHVSPILLHLRPVVKDVFMSWLEDTYPDLVARYQSMYRKSAYASQKERDDLSGEIKAILSDPAIRAKRRSQPRRFRRKRDEKPRPPKSEQLSLI